MPLYEYRCAKCSKVFEVLQKFSDAALKKHPDCGGKVERLISAPGLQFKGSGWYITDYARAGSSKGESKSESSSESKSESKPDSNSTETKASETKSSESKPKKKAS